MGAAAVGRIERDTLLATFYERLGQDAAGAGDFKTAVHYRELAISFVRRACTVIEHELHELRIAYSRGDLVAAGARLRADARPRGAGRPAARRKVATRAGPDDDSDPEPPALPWRSDRCPCCLEWRMWRGGELICINGACPEFGL